MQMASVDLYCTRPELKPDFYKWNTSVCGHQQPLISCGEYVPMGDEYFQLADSFAECARNNDTMYDNYITPPLDWMMVRENQVILCFALLFSCLIFFLIKHPNMVSQIFQNSTPINQFISTMCSTKIPNCQTNQWTGFYMITANKWKVQALNLKKTFNL